MQIQRGDSVAQIIGRVRDESWASNPEVWAYEGDIPRVFFGHLRTYLRGDQRFRILVRPATCAHCDHQQDRRMKRWCSVGEFTYGVRRAESLLSPVIAIAQGTTRQLSAGHY